MSETDTRPEITENRGTVRLSIRNMGGIEHSSFGFEPGVTILAGRNATNRTSILNALGGVLGGSSGTLKSDADEGSVTLELPEEDSSFERTYTRRNRSVSTDGTPFSDRETLVDYFVILLESNPARRAAEAGEGLREVIMRPVDTDQIERRISRLKSDLQSVDDELAEVERRRRKLPQLEERRQTLETELAELDDELETVRAEVVEFEADLSDAEEADELVESLEERRGELTSVRNEREVKQSELDALREESAELEAELDDLTELDRSDVGDLEATRSRQQDLDETINSLMTIIEFNEELLDEASDLLDLTASDDVTAGLAPDSDRDVVCWTCGSVVKREAIDDRVADLRDLVEEKRDRRQEVKAHVEELEERRREIRESVERRERLEQRIESVEEKTAARERSIESLDDRIESLREEISSLEAAVAETEGIRDNDLLERYERISDLQYERGQVEQRLADVEAEVDDIESLPDPSELRASREELQSEVAAERNRVEELETSALEAFNQHMTELLDVLEYENVAKVWVERKSDGGGRSGDTASFDLHIVRETAGGTGYEDVVDNLSESERELIGLVVALSGYLVHEVYEEVPFILLDSVEAMDSNRIAKLVSYFADYSQYLVVALLPEDAAALDNGFERVSPEEFAG